MVPMIWAILLVFGASDWPVETPNEKVLFPLDVAPVFDEFPNPNPLEAPKPVLFDEAPNPVEVLLAPESAPPPDAATPKVNFPLEAALAISAFIFSLSRR